METTNENIVRQIAGGDEAAFARLYDAWWSYMCATAATFIHNGEAAKEIVNDIFVKTWKNRRSLRSPIAPYLMAALRNSCLNYLRGQKDGFPGMGGGEIEHHTPLSYTEMQETLTTVRKVTDSLPGRCRLIFHLYFFEGMDTKDIALRLGISPATVRVQLKTALDRIRAALEG